MKKPLILPPYCRPINGLRGLMAIWVVFFHLIRFREYEWSGIFSFLNLGYLGVDVFFVLSGFILSHVYLNWNFSDSGWKNYKKYLGLRLARIYPLHIFILLVFVSYLIIATLLGLRSGDIASLNLNAAILQALLVETWLGRDHPSWNIPSWSISAEFFSYLLFPLIVSYAKTFSHTAIIAYILASFIGAIIFNFFNDGLSTTVELGLIRVFIEFNIGCALFQFVRRFELSLPQANLLFWGSIIGIIAYFYVNEAGQTEIFFLFLVMFLVVGIFRGNTKLHEILGNRIFFYFGEISYAIYMVHWLIYHLYVNISDQLPEFFRLPLVTMAFVLLATVGSAMALYHWVELPSRQYLRSKVTTLPDNKKST